MFWEGPFPEVGGYGQEGELGRAWASEMPDYLVLLLSGRTNVSVEILLALPRGLKAVRCNRDRLLSLDQRRALFSVTLIKDLTFCQP